jgi:hypothetical protein
VDWECETDCQMRIAPLPKPRVDASPATASSVQVLEPPGSHLQGHRTKLMPLARDAIVAADQILESAATLEPRCADAACNCLRRSSSLKADGQGHASP